MSIILKNKTTQNINNNTIITYNFLINNKFNLSTYKIYKNNKFSHNAYDDNDHNILLNNNIKISSRQIFNLIK